MTEQYQVEINETTLLERARGGDTVAFHELVKGCERGIFAMALLLLKNREDAEDVAQEAVLKAFKKLRDFRDPSHSSAPGKQSYSHGYRNRTASPVQRVYRFDESVQCP